MPGLQHAGDPPLYPERHILPALKERALGRDGHHVIKHMIEIRDLEVAMPSRQVIQEQHKRRIGEATVSAPRRPVSLPLFATRTSGSDVRLFRGNAEASGKLGHPS